MRVVCIDRNTLFLCLLGYRVGLSRSASCQPTRKIWFVNIVTLLFSRNTLHHEMSPPYSSLSLSYPSLSHSQYELPGILPTQPPTTPAFYWLVTDMYTFENIGFSKIRGDIRYLACADCEIGPIGYQDPNEARFLVACDRVRERE